MRKKDFFLHFIRCSITDFSYHHQNKIKWNGQVKVSHSRRKGNGIFIEQNAIFFYFENIIKLTPFIHHHDDYGGGIYNRIHFNDH